MSNYSIKDLEHLTGIKAHTIRIWEQRYNIIEPKRTDTNIRYYDSEDLKHMLNISLLNNNGFKISKIAKMGRDELCERVLETINKNKVQISTDDTKPLIIENFFLRLSYKRRFICLEHMYHV